MFVGTSRYYGYMDRLTLFNKLQKHPWLHKVWARLKPADLEIARNFLQANAGMDKNQFAVAAERMFCNMATPPKRQHEIVELLICANSALEGGKRD